MRTCIIYVVTSPSGKQYVGITSQPLKGRWASHCWDAANGSKLPLHSAIRKYGAATLFPTVVASCRTLADAQAVEPLLIQQYQTRHPSGYNMTSGGEGCPGYVDTPEMKAARSAALRGKKRSPEQRARMSAAQKAVGVTPAKLAALAGLAEKRKGVPLSDSHATACSAAQKGKTKPDSVKQKIADSVRRKWAFRKLLKEQSNANA